MKNNGGMTLVEVIVAMAILFIIFLGMSSAGLVVLDQNIKNSQ
ncbi:MAG: prepilin-type N-terminal cleavage/methylation domain-containing protein, partial [Deltaproteobacteria bacterium]